MALLKKRVSEEVVVFYVIMNEYTQTKLSTRIRGARGDFSSCVRTERFLRRVARKPLCARSSVFFHFCICELTRGNFGWHLHSIVCARIWMAHLCIGFFTNFAQEGEKRASWNMTKITKYYPNGGLLFLAFQVRSSRSSSCSLNSTHELTAYSCARRITRNSAASKWAWAS